METISPGRTFYPNPASDVITLEFGMEREQKGEVRILNLMGQHLKSIPLRGGLTRYQLPLRDLAPGTYLFELNIEDAPHSYHKVVISR